MTERSFDSLWEAVGAAETAETLQGALERIVPHLQQEFALWGAVLLRFVSRDAVRIVASWSVTETVFVTGTEISVHFTPETAALAQALFLGQPVIFRRTELDLGMLSALQMQEGVEATAMIPLRADETVSAVLSLRSPSADTFGPEVIPYLTGLGRGIERKIATLIRLEEQRTHPSATSTEHTS